jgi:hypothetical protein
MDHNSGLAQAIALRVIHDGDELDSMAGAVEELINSCDGIELLLWRLSQMYPVVVAAALPEVKKFRAAVERAKNWK